MILQPDGQVEGIADHAAKVAKVGKHERSPPAMKEIGTKSSPPGSFKKIPGSVSFENVRRLTPDEDELHHKAAFVEDSKDSGTNILVERWVLKQSRWLGHWRWRWLVLTPVHLRFYGMEHGNSVGAPPTEEFEVRTVRGVSVLADGEIEPVVQRATPLSCVLLLEKPEPHHSIVKVRIDARSVLLAVTSSGSSMAPAGMLATSIVNASIATRTNNAAYRTPGTRFAFEPRGLVTLRDRYAIGGEIGRGHFGTVFSARCLQSGRAVAIKKVPLIGRGTMPGRNPVRARVHAEVEILLEVRSPYIVELLNYVEEGPCMGCLVMELLPGGDLYTQVVERYWPNSEERTGDDGAETGDKSRRASQPQPCGYSERDVVSIMRMALRAQPGCERTSTPSFCEIRLGIRACRHSPRDARALLDSRHPRAQWGWRPCTISRFAIAT